MPLNTAYAFSSPPSEHDTHEVDRFDLNDLLTEFLHGAHAWTADTDEDGYPYWHVAPDYTTPEYEASKSKEN